LKDGNSTVLVISSFSGNGGSATSIIGSSISSVTIDGFSPDSLSDSEYGEYSNIGSIILPYLNFISSQGIGVIDRADTLCISKFLIALLFGFGLGFIGI
jgi:hypothetical protein